MRFISFNVLMCFKQLISQFIRLKLISVKLKFNRIHIWWVLCSLFAWGGNWTEQVTWFLGNRRAMVWRQDMSSFAPLLQDPWGLYTRRFSWISQYTITLHTDICFFQFQSFSLAHSFKELSQVKVTVLKSRGIQKQWFFFFSSHCVFRFCDLRWSLCW